MLLKNFRGSLKIIVEFINCERSSISSPRPIQPYNFHANLIWVDGPLKQVSLCLNIVEEVKVLTFFHHDSFSTERSSFCNMLEVYVLRHRCYGVL